MKLEDYTDENLLALSASGDTRATDIIMERYKNLVRKLAGERFLPGGERDDLIQEGMIGLFRAARDFDSSCGAFPAFAELCIKRQMMKALESAGRQKNAPLNNYTSISPGDDETGAEQIPEDDAKSPESIVVGSMETEERLGRLGKSLSPFEGKVLILMAKGHAYTEIADILGTTPKSVDNARQRIRKKAEAAL